MAAQCEGEIGVLVAVGRGAGEEGTAYGAVEAAVAAVVVDDDDDDDDAIA
jgi:hypothetical protein